MAQKWHYSKGDEKFGPVSVAELKNLVSSGELQPTDLVWREGLKEWKRASSLKGLFPDSPSISATPPLPTENQPPPIPAATTAASVPPLWNPMAVRAWSLLFTWGFGAFLTAKNWKALGNQEREKRNTIWFYSIFPFLFLAIITPDTYVITKTFNFVGIVILLVWIIIESEHQLKYVKNQFGKDYPRKEWGKPIGIGFACIALPVIGLLASMEDTASSPVFKNTQRTFDQVDVFTNDSVVDDSVSETESGLVVEDAQFYTGEFGNRLITGTVINPTNRTYNYAQIEINLYDRDGNLLGSTIANINNFEAGGRWKFEAVIFVINEDKVVDFKVKNITAY